VTVSTDDIVAIYQLESFCHHAIDHVDLSLLPAGVHARRAL